MVECYVDESGRYTRNMGLQLEGKEVLTEGSQAVLNMLKKHVVHSHKCTHSYPYDWRTKKARTKALNENWGVIQIFVWKF